MIRFDFDERKCTACGACAVACMDQNDIDIEGGQQPYRRVYRYETDTSLFSISIACLHCPDARCSAVCPSDCLTKDLDNGLIRCDNAQCIGCRMCARVCPYGAPTFRRVESGYRMEKCHGCEARLENGLDPACVRACPSGALTICFTDDRAARQRLTALYETCDPKGAHML